MNFKLKAVKLKERLEKLQRVVYFDLETQESEISFLGGILEKLKKLVSKSRKERFRAIRSKSKGRRYNSSLSYPKRSKRRSFEEDKRSDGLGDWKRNNSRNVEKNRPRGMSSATKKLQNLQNRVKNQNQEEIIKIKNERCFEDFGPENHLNELKPARATSSTSHFNPETQNGVWLVNIDNRLSADFKAFERRKSHRKQYTKAVKSVPPSKNRTQTTRSNFASQNFTDFFKTKIQSPTFPKSEPSSVMSPLRDQSLEMTFKQSKSKDEMFGPEHEFLRTHQPEESSLQWYWAPGRRNGGVGGSQLFKTRQKFHYPKKVVKRRDTSFEVTLPQKMPRFVKQNVPKINLNLDLAQNSKIVKKASRPPPLTQRVNNHQKMVSQPKFAPKVSARGPNWGLLSYLKEPKYNKNLDGFETSTYARALGSTRLKQENIPNYNSLRYRRSKMKMGKNLKISKNQKKGIKTIPQPHSLINLLRKVKLETGSDKKRAKEAEIRKISSRNSLAKKRSNHSSTRKRSRQRREQRLQPLQITSESNSNRRWSRNLINTQKMKKFSISSHKQFPAQFSSREPSQISHSKKPSLISRSSNQDTQRKNMLHKSAGKLRTLVTQVIKPSRSARQRSRKTSQGSSERKFNRVRKVAESSGMMRRVAQKTKRASAMVPRESLIRPPMGFAELGLQKSLNVVGGGSGRRGERYRGGLMGRAGRRSIGLMVPAYELLKSMERSGSHNRLSKGGG